MINVLCCLFFFFSSRRRHTRCSRDWSSDVCSSDLETAPQDVRVFGNEPAEPKTGQAVGFAHGTQADGAFVDFPADRLPAACEVYERAVSLGSMSKTYGLPGLRLGWLVSQDAGLPPRCVEPMDYNTNF